MYLSIGHTYTRVGFRLFCGSLGS